MNTDQTREATIERLANVLDGDRERATQMLKAKEQEIEARRILSEHGRTYRELKGYTTPLPSNSNPASEKSRDR